MENKLLARRTKRIEFHNLSIKLAKSTILYNAVVLIKHQQNDLDSLAAVLCLHCGIAPLTLMSDGNAKNSIYVGAGCENLVFEKTDEKLYTLEEFVREWEMSIIFR